MKRINDAELLRLFKEGKPQKEIALIMGVTPPAICKRLKRLMPPPKSLEALTDKERRFCRAIVSGKTQTLAAMESYEVSSLDSAKSMGSRLMGRPEIQTAVSDLMIQNGLSRDYRIKRLKQLVDNPDPMASLKALDMSFKLDNSYPPARSMHLNITADLSPVDLSAYLTDRAADGAGDGN